jgi:hypothetical protein
MPLTKLPELMTCSRHIGQENADHWLQHDSGDRVCEYCGSLHPDDFFSIVAEAAYASASVEPSDKPYKIYARRTGVKSATDGGIKFYTHHLLVGENGRRAVTDEQQALFARAVRATGARAAKALMGKFVMGRR